jgi:hypothetical protein
LKVKERKQVVSGGTLITGLTATKIWSSQVETLKGICHEIKQKEEITMMLIITIVLLFLLFGGGGGYYWFRWR